MRGDKAKADFVAVTHIRCTPEQLWEALMNERTSSLFHFFGASVRTDGIVGGRYDQCFPADAAIVGGEILATEQEKRLEVTFEPLWEALMDEKTSSLFHFFGASVRTDGIVGGRYDQCFPADAAIVGGEILAIEQEKRLEVTFEPLVGRKTGTSLACRL